MSFRVERDDLELELLALVDDVARMGHALMGQLADMDQPFEPVAYPNKGPEVDEFCDGSIDHVADVEVGDRRMPRVGLEPTDGQADPTTLQVDVDDLGLDLLADAITGFGVVDLVPRQLALVNQAVDPAEIDEHPKRRDRANSAVDLLPNLEAAEEFVALFAALLVQRDLLGQDQPVRLAVDLEDLEPELAADERHQLLGDLLGGIARLVVLGSAGEVHNLADRHEAADPAIDDQAALVVVDDRGVDDDPRLELLLHGAPLALEASPAQRQDHMALGRLWLQHIDKDRVANVERRLAFAVTTKQLAIADDALALRPDIDEDLVLVDPHHLALDNVAVLEALDVRVLLGEELLHRRGLRTQLADWKQLRLVVARSRRVGGLVCGQRRVPDSVRGPIGHAIAQIHRDRVRRRLRGLRGLRDLRGLRGVAGCGCLD